MLGPRRGAQACLQQIWNRLVMFSSMWKCRWKEYEDRVVRCTEFGDGCFMKNVQVTCFTAFLVDVLFA
jgi:hypothetical protein